MPHVHNVLDTDSHFLIDPVTRSITTKADKLYVVQYDHDSERFTFQIPRYVEEHDMSLCNRIEVHYSNVIRTKKQQNDDVYVVKQDDCTADNDTLFFSWLISSNATKLVGFLNFSITFLCIDEAGNVAYEWGTSVCDSVQVLAKNRNTQAALQDYPDLYSQLKKEIIDNLPIPSDGQSPTIEIEEVDNGFALNITDVNGSKSIVLNHGSDGEPGISPVIVSETIENGHMITITDVNGDHVFELTNGKDGEVDYDQVAQMVESYLIANPPVAKVTINGIEPDENGEIKLDLSTSGIPSVDF